MPKPFFDQSIAMAHRLCYNNYIEIIILIIFHGEDFMGENKRLNHFDLLKVVAMLFVCFAHVYQRTMPGGTKTVVFGVFYSVHMSMFMFVGGYFIKRCERFLDVIKYFLKMLAYYIYPAILFTILTVVSMKRYSGKTVIEWLGELVVRTDTFYWYGIAAFIINGLLAVAYYLSQKLFKREDLHPDLIKNGLTLVLFAVFMLPFIFISRSKNYGLLSSNLIIEFVPLVVLGFIFKSFGKYFKPTKRLNAIELLFAGLCLALYVLALYNFKGWLDKSTTQKLVLHQLGAICGVYYYYVLTKWLVKIEFFDKVSALGKYSYPLYLVHVYLIRVITPYVSAIKTVDFYSVSFIVIYALTFAFGSLAISVLLTKNKYVNLVLFGDYKRLLNKKNPHTEKDKLSPT